MEAQEHRARLESARRQKDEAFRAAAWSPIPPAARRHFQGLVYFAPDLAYRHVVPLEPGDREVLQVPLSTGGVRAQVRAGWFSLALPDGQVRLAAYETEGHMHGELFVPFRDATSGKETYGAGRYVEARATDDGRYVVDLNDAYNPYCAYSEAYACPLPPPENWLRVPVRAGERYEPMDEAASDAEAAHPHHDHGHHR